jgi:5-methylcytosine-specific restriction endonuclease McrA
MPGDLPEVHHRNGKHSDTRRDNLAALHRHCHDAVHGKGKVAPAESVRAKDCSSEEPYECESLMYGCASRKG